MNNFILEAIGHMEGLTDAQIAKLEADAPAISQLIALSIKAKPLIEQAIPLFQQALTEWQTVGPDVEMVLALVNKGTKA